MKTINVNNTNQFMDAVKNSVTGDTLVMQPGEYFSNERSEVLTIDKNLTIEGLYTNAKAVKLNCAFIVSSNTTLIMKNLFMTSNDDHFNTLALYDNAELFGDNIIVDRDNTKYNGGWDTIFAKDSAVSLTNSDILADRGSNHIGLSLENSQSMILDSNIYGLCLKNSITYIKNVLISYAIVLMKHATLSYVDLALDSLCNKDSDFYIADNSTVNGVNLKIFKKEPFIDIIGSQFQNDIFTNDATGIRWCFDDASTILIDGKTPYNSGL